MVKIFERNYTAWEIVKILEDLVKVRHYFEWSHYGESFWLELTTTILKKLEEEVGKLEKGEEKHGEV